MSYETILVERKDKIGVIKLNRPQQRNALSVQLITDVVAALRDFDNDPQINVVVIMSNLPTVFCAGKDLAESSSNLAAGILRQREISRTPVELWFTLRNMKKIVIAAVNGYALAGGTGFAISCDIVIASEDAVFGLTEVNVGLFPMTISPAMVRNTSSPKKCFELCVTGERFGAREAERLGMVNKVVPPDKLIEETMKFASEIAEKSPSALQVGKQFFYNMLDMEYAQATKYAAEMLSILAISDDGKEGMRAFLEKRKPVWKQASQGTGK